ncbi:hypothetical protein WPS_30800 [Vulcanimicrobium alpinum]|uniref:Uncharacterized protein n=1 Tax=Vulcanimicrobium alpinum TaxID=3016050 RepID=A0AAN1XYP2_UNVUL|nr:hypothetical protein [Vulcanimicrobium alpinum]BDE07804.1 hypothetical protein WPS_30800 [Vulcanimicrobium alpinum]
MSPTALRFALIGAGIVAFVLSEVVQQRFNRKPVPTGARRDDQISRDAAVFGLRILGAVLVAGTLVSWEWANRSPLH